MPESRIQQLNLSDSQLVDRVVYINRVCKVTKGGKRFKFSAVVVVGDQNGIVGAALGKAKEVPEAIRKAVEKAKRDACRIPIVNNTIPHPIVGEFGSTKVVMRPAAEGTGVIAGGAVRAVLEAAGVKNILAKCVGSRNPYNSVLATMNGLQRLMEPEVYHGRLREGDEVEAEQAEVDAAAEAGLEAMAAEGGEVELSQGAETPSEEPPASDDTTGIPETSDG